MTNDEVWRPGADPNAETERAWPAGPGASIPRQQGGHGEDGEPGLAETRLALPEELAARPSVVAPRSGSRLPRRRVLFAAGGVMLLAGGGAATAAAVEGQSRHASASGGPSRTPSGGPTPSRSGAGSQSATASATASSSPSSPSASSSSGSPSGSPTGSPSGSGQVAKQPQWYVDDQGPMAIALTMDDGPSAQYTPQVLEILAQYGIKATFNMVGSLVRSNLSVVREVSAAGHTITNHTWDHADLSRLSVNEVLSEIDRTNEALADANQTPTIFRAPYGNWSKAVFEACAERNLRPVGWSVDPRDWDFAHVTTQEIVQTVMRHTHAHDIILEHDGGGDRSHTVAALREFIPALQDKGFKFVAM